MTTDNTMQTLDMTLSLPPKAKLNQASGSLLHGFIMEQIDTDYADYLHSQEVRPYSQFIKADSKKNLLHWRISALDSEASNKLLQPLLEMEPSIYLKRKKTKLTIQSRCLSDVQSYKELAQKYFLPEKSAKHLKDTIKFKFMTSTGFKSSGQYLIFPDAYLIFNSLLRRFNAFSGIDSFMQKGLAQNLMQEVHVDDYDLHYSPFSVEGRKIPAFKGTYSLKISKNDMACRIISMLSEYAAYAGVGIKTSLGMGAVKAD